MNRNTIEKKKGNSIHFSFSFSFTFFFSLYFSFIPFLLHALTNSFLFLFFFSSFLIFTIGENNFSSLSFSLSLFFFFNLVFLSFFFSLGFWPYHISNLEEVSPSFFLRHFWRLYNFNCQALGRKLPFLFSLSPIRHLLTNHFLVHLIFQHWGREFLISFSFSLSLFLSTTMREYSATTFS